MQPTKLTPFTVFILGIFMLTCACSNTPSKPSNAKEAVLSQSPWTNASALCADSVRYTGTTDPHFLIVSDVHLDTSAQTIIPGEDTGMKLWKKTQSKIDSILNHSPRKPDFILYLGDLPVHTNPGKLKWAGISHVLNGLESLSENADIPLLYLPGNNDGLGLDYSAFSIGKSQKPPYTITADPSDWPMIEDAGPCDTHGTQACIIDDTHRSEGYYSAFPTPDHRLRVIALNTVQFVDSSRHHQYTPIDSQHVQAPRQLKWLRTQLALSRAASDEKVILAMHIPPGQSAYCKSSGDVDLGIMWRDNFTDASGNSYSIQDTFMSIIYDDVLADADHIVGIFTSHTHMDEIRILNDPDGKPMKVAISTPGVTVNHKNNPGMKIVHYDPSQGYAVTDFTTLFTRLNTPVWGDRAYAFSEAYGCSGTDIFSCISSKVNQGNTGEVYTSMTSVLSVCSFEIVCDIEASLTVN